MSVEKKIKILFIIDSLGTGGAERSLLNLLYCMDYSRFEVDIQLLSYEGLLTNQLPMQVNQLPLPSIINKLSKSPYQLRHKPLLFLKRAIYSLAARSVLKRNRLKVSLYWMMFKNEFERNDKEYDFSIGYSQGYSTFYCLDKTKAPKKFVWVNINYNLKSFSRIHQKQYYKKADKIITVSDIVYNTFSLNVFPEFKSKMLVIRDIINPAFIWELANRTTNIKMESNLPVIMTTGRLDKSQKGFDLALQTAGILKERGVDFRWYAIGEGPYEEEMVKYIKSNGLEESFILLGPCLNPYALMAKCDIYVQPSRHEGYGLTVAEAKILEKPCVLTPFNTSELHVNNGVNGLIANSFSPVDIADNIQLLLNNRDLYDKIVDSLQKERKGNVEEIEKFYRLIEWG